MFKPGNEIVCWHFYWKEILQRKALFLLGKAGQMQGHFSPQPPCGQSLPVWGGKPPELD